MRVRWLTALFLLTACDAYLPASSTVDPTTLGPLSAKELALLAAADGELRNGDTASAEHDYLEAVASSHGHIEAHLALTSLYQSQHRLASAKPVLERAHGFQPQNPEVDYLLGKIAIQQNDPASALDYFNQGLISAPNNIDLLNGIGIAYDMLAQHSHAQTTYARALAHNPPPAARSMLRTNLAMSYLLSNQPKKAAQLLQREAKQPGASPVARHNLALALGILGKSGEARTLVSKEMSEEDRQQVIAQLRSYLAERAATAPPANDSSYPSPE